MHQPRRSLSLLGRSAVIGALALAALSGFLWVAPLLFGPIGIISLGSGTNLRLGRGEAEIRHIYEYDIAPPVPTDQWFATAVSRGWVNPPYRQITVPRFGFSSGHVLGVGGRDATSPARYWLLYVPLWVTMLPGIVIGAWLVARWRRKRQERRRGFAVVARDLPPAPSPCG